MQSFRQLSLAVLATLAVFSVTGCNGSKNAESPDKGGAAAGGEKGAPGGGAGKGGRGGAGGPVSVLVAKATMRDVPILAEVIGNVEASSTVILKPQISGQLMQAHFQEGDFVTKGQLLLSIDPRQLEAQMKQTEAQVLRDQAALQQSQAALARDKAQSTNAGNQAERADQLFKQGILSKDQRDQFATTAISLTATLQADEAAIENARATITASRAAVDSLKVQLAYTKIYAPVSGRTGTLMVKPGNIVTANTTELANILQVQPVYVTFALPEVNLASLRGSMGKKLPVTAISEEGGAKQTGALAFFENAVDMTTGTIRLKASFVNAERNLWPGQFVRVTLQLGLRSDAVLVPNQAVQSGQDGTFVYIVEQDQKVSVRPVVTAQRIGEETVIEKGLTPGETVVTEGTLRLVPGARVQVREPQGPGGPGGGGRKGGMKKS